MIIIIIIIIIIIMIIIIMNNNNNNNNNNNTYHCIFLQGNEQKTDVIEDELNPTWNKVCECIVINHVA